MWLTIGHFHCRICAHLSRKPSWVDMIMTQLETCGSGREEDKQWARRNPADLENDFSAFQMFLSCDLTQVSFFLPLLSRFKIFLFRYLTPLLAIGTLSAAKWASTSLLTWEKFLAQQQETETFFITLSVYGESSEWSKEGEVDNITNRHADLCEECGKI